MTVSHKSEGRMCWHRPPSAPSVWYEWSQKWAWLCFECSSKINLSFSEDDTRTDLSYWLDLKPGRDLNYLPSIPLLSLLCEGVFTETWSDGVRHYDAFEEEHLHQWEQQVCMKGFWCYANFPASMQSLSRECFNSSLWAPLSDKLQSCLTRAFSAMTIQLSKLLSDRSCH